MLQLCSAALTPPILQQDQCAQSPPDTTDEGSEELEAVYVWGLVCWGFRHTPSLHLHRKSTSTKKKITTLTAVTILNTAQNPLHSGGYQFLTSSSESQNIIDLF